MDWSKRLELTNVQTLCHTCHNKKTKEEKRK
ncbi:HNH endonuclease [Bacillus toyonensis]|nr:HNH endonuclease [Bacillus toyonensis]